MTKFPFFSKGANHLVDQPFAHKKLSYIQGYFDCGSARWIDPLNQLLGAILIDKWATRPEHDREKVPADTCIPLQSGYGGPTVLQIPSGDW